MQTNTGPKLPYQPSVGIYFDTRRATMEGNYPVKIRVIFRQGNKFIQKYFPIGIYLTRSEYEKVKHNKAIAAHLKRKATIITTQLAKALDLVSVNPRISPDLFTAMFTGKVVTSTSLVAVFGQMKKADAQRLFGSTKNSLLAFANSTDIPLSIIDKDWLKEYETWMLAKGKSITTVAIYLRNLRTAFNFAISQKIITADYYPFGRHGYHIPQTQNIKKALSPETINRLLSAEAHNDQEAFSLACFRFCYYCVGINFVDIARLKAENIHGDTLMYFRQKTRSTSHTRKPIIIPLHAQAREVLNQYGNQSPYLFGIIDDSMTDFQKYHRIKSWRKRTVQTVQAIAGRLGIKEKIVIYTARHTAANRLLTQGTDIKTLQDLLGHSSILTTERYVAGLDIEKKKVLIKAL